LILNLITNEEVENFRLSSNNKDFGSFDDVVVEIKYFKSEAWVTYAVQLKYKEEKKSVVINGLTKNCGLEKVKKYIESCKFHQSVLLIYFTNSTFDQFKENGKSVVVTYDNKIVGYESSSLDSLLSIKKQGQCYKFGIKDGNLSEEEAKFFNSFYLYSGQVSVPEIRSSTCEKFEKLFDCNSSDAFTQYINFIEEWCLSKGRNGTKKKLDKRRMQRVVALRVLSEFIRPLSFSSNEVSQNTKLLRQIISNHHVTTFDQKNYDQVKTLWEDAKSTIDVKEINDIRREYQVTEKYVEKLEDLDDKKTSAILWLMEKCPLVIDGNDKVENIVKLLRNEKFIVLSPKFSLRDVSSKFQRFSDLEEEDKTSLQNIKCSLYCTDEVTLKDLNYDRLDDVTTDDLVALTKNTLLIREKEEVLPPCHITRSLSKTTLEFDCLKKISKNNVVLITGSENEERFKCRFKDIKFIPMENQSPTNNGGVYTSQKELSEEEFKELRFERCHQFRYVDDETLEWVRSKGSIEELREYQLESKYFMEEGEFFDSCFTNQVNIICANPGIGKTTLMKSLKNSCLERNLTVLVTCRIHSSYFRKRITDPDQFIEYILNETLKKCANRQLVLHFLKCEGRMQFFWDGLDEINVQNLETVKNIVKNLSGKRHRQWITSRNNLKCSLETSFNVFAKTLTQFNDDQQRKYIGNRLKCVEKESEIFQIIKRNTDIFPYNNILGIPLQIFMLTELLRTNQQKYLDLLNKTFSLAQLYEHFVEQKFIVYFREKENFNENNDDLSDRNEKEKNSRICDYRNVAFAKYFKKDIASVNSRSKQFLTEIKNNNNKDIFGFVTSVSEELVPEFCHNSFGEYFAGSYIAENKKEVVKESDLSDEKYSNIRFFVDLILAKDSEPHLYVLYRNSNLLKEKVSVSQLNCEDSAGRSPYEVACTWRKKYPLHKITKSTLKDSNDTRHFTKSLKKVSPEELELQKIIIHLESHCQTSNVSLFFRDFYIFLPFTKISVYDLIQIGKLKNNDDFTILFYAVQFDYSTVFNSFKIIPHMTQLLELGCEFKSAETLKFILSNRSNKDTLLKNVKLLSKMCCPEFTNIFQDCGIDVNLKDKEGMTVAHYVCREHNYEAVTFLIQFKADLDSADQEGKTPLHCACQTRQDLDILDEMLKDPKSESPFLNSSGELKRLIKSFESRNHRDPYQVVENLIENKAKVNTVDRQGKTPLHYACESAFEDVVSLLIEKNADVKIRDKCGKTPLHCACQNASDNLTIILTNRGADVNALDKSSRTPLHYACSHASASVIEILLAKGAKVDTEDEDKKTPLHHAAINPTVTVEMVEVLLRNGASMDAKDENGKTPLHYACENAPDNVVDFLIKSSQSVNVEDNHGKTPLHYACANSNHDVVKLLIDGKGCLDQKDKSGKLPLHYACGSVLDEVTGGFLEMMLKKGANVNDRDASGKTALHYVCDNEYVVDNAVDMLTKAGADVNAKDESGKMPLHYACQNRYVSKSAVKILIEKGAKVNVADNSHRLPLKYAEENQLDHVVTVLNEHISKMKTRQIASVPVPVRTRSKSMLQRFQINKPF
jgi:ankyrin repeat protein